MSEAPTNKVPNIVVIDDDHELLKLITMLLRRIGAESTVFDDGQDALTYLQTHHSDLIILDLMLPDMDGFDVLRQIRDWPSHEQVPVLILSAKADPNTIRYGLENGADSYVTKPYIANSLIDRVRLLLNVGRQSSQARANQPPPGPQTN